MAERYANTNGVVVDDEGNYSMYEDSEARAMVADEYSPSSTYSAGEPCIINNGFYIAKQDISTPEAWNEAHWEKTSIAAWIKQTNALLKTCLRVVSFDSGTGELVTVSGDNDGSV